MEGKVKFYNVSKRFGFIAGDDGTDYFVHQSGIAPGTRLNEGDRVSFDVVQGERGPKAENVKKVES
ncbi:MAG: cold shock domain-containing protein [Candidatus Micrarchaeota archaeon]